jgi:hypothetical protein
MRTAHDMHVLDGPNRTRATDENERVIFGSRKVAENGEQVMSMHPNKFNTTGWYDKLLLHYL